MFRFQSQITYTKNMGDLKQNIKGSSIDANGEMTGMLEFSDKNFKLAMIKMLHEQL